MSLSLLFSETKLFSRIEIVFFLVFSNKPTFQALHVLFGVCPYFDIISDRASRSTSTRNLHNISGSSTQSLSGPKIYMPILSSASDMPMFLCSIICLLRLMSIGTSCMSAGKRYASIIIAKSFGQPLVPELLFANICGVLPLGRSLGDINLIKVHNYRV